MIDHPWSLEQDGCVYCGSPEFGEFIMTRDRALDELVPVHWVCDPCEREVHGGHGEEWTREERETADRMWSSAGKEVSV